MSELKPMAWIDDGEIDWYASDLEGMADGTNLYAIPEGCAVVPRELLDRVIHRLDKDTFAPFGEPYSPENAIRRAIADELRATLAQQAYD